MKHTTSWNIHLYIFNLALLITHQIESAYWKEWELFGMSGDIQGFLIANFILVLFVFIGLKKLLLEKKSGYFFALFFSCTGIFAFVIHSVFILQGHPEFTTPVSYSILILTLIVSIVQAIFAVKALRKSEV
jgi:hypothetical protein